MKKHKKNSHINFTKRKNWGVALEKIARTLGGGHEGFVWEKMGKKSVGGRS